MVYEKIRPKTFGGKMKLYNLRDDNKRLQEEITELKERLKIADFIKKLEEYPNPYPKDIFMWDNTEKLDFNRGRFHRHCFEIVENVRNDLIKELEEKQWQKAY